MFCFILKKKTVDKRFNSSCQWEMHFYRWVAWWRGTEIVIFERCVPQSLNTRAKWRFSIQEFYSMRLTGNLFGLHLSRAQWFIRLEGNWTHDRATTVWHLCVVRESENCIANWYFVLLNALFTSCHSFHLLFVFSFIIFNYFIINILFVLAVYCIHFGFRWIHFCISVHSEFILFLFCV